MKERSWITSLQASHDGPGVGLHPVHVSHVNDSGQSRGSRNIQLVADLQIELFRDPNAAQAAERHKTHLNIRKNRFDSMTSPAGVLTFNPDTFIVAELEDFGLPPLEASNAIKKWGELPFYKNDKQAKLIDTLYDEQAGLSTETDWPFLPSYEYVHHAFSYTEGPKDVKVVPSDAGGGSVTR